RLPVPMPGMVIGLAEEKILVLATVETGDHRTALEEPLLAVRLGRGQQDRLVGAPLQRREQLVAGLLGAAANQLRMIDAGEKDPIRQFQHSATSSQRQIRLP